MAGPLSHIKVLDMSRIMAGPWASQILADLGADVIKVERPGAGDDTRHWGPPFLKDAEGRPTSESGYYLSVNRGKRSVSIDIAAPAGQELIKTLVARSDILLENFKVGALAKFGLGQETLRALNPKLIYASVTGFGQTGPMAHDGAYDFAIQAMGGLMSVTGERDDCPGGGPQKVGVPIVDLMTGMYTAVSVLAALANREKTGRGDYIDIAMFDVQLAFLANQAMNYLVSGRTPTRTGNQHPNIQPQDKFRCSDGNIVLAVGNDRQFSKLCNVLGRSELAADEAFSSNKARVQNLERLREIIDSLLLQDTAKHWCERLRCAGVPCAPINSIPEALAEPQSRSREMLQYLKHPLADNAPQVVSPMRFSEASLAFERPPPMLGEHTIEVLGELGLSNEEIDALNEDSVI